MSNVKDEDTITREVDERISEISEQLADQEALQDELERLQALRAALKTTDETDDDE